MKKILFVATFSLMLTTVTFAQSNNPDQTKGLSLIIKSQLAADFPDATNVYFANKKNYSEVSFTQENENISACYDNRNQLVGTLQEKTFVDLPDNAKKEILNKYPGYAIVDVIKFNDNENNESEMIQNGTSYDDSENYFVELKNDSNPIVVKIDLSGVVSYLTTLK